MSVVTWLPAQSFLYGYVDTDLPGHRQVKPIGSTRTVAAGYYRFDALIAALNTAMSADSWTATIANTGQVTLSAAGAATFEFPDSLGWLLGCAEGPNVATQSVDTIAASRVSPACIPLLGAEWRSVDSVVEDSITRDRTQRGHGHTWGGGREWEWLLTMTRSAYEALTAGGWCLRSQVSIEGGTATAVGSSVPGGALTGYALSLGRPSWRGPHLQFCDVSLRMGGVTS